jgi:N-acetylglucosaminyldiphosphoundecaprenol N-acetyl-beta-D-mannosaminyltransferase
MPQAVARIRAWVASGERECKLVVTPNVDHVVQLHRRPDLIPIYQTANMTLADGWPLVTMSRLYGKPLPERVSGADLLPSLCDSYEQSGEQLKVFLLGGIPGVPERAAASIEETWPNVSVVGTCSPEFGFERCDATNRVICDQVSDARADVLVVGLGFPKQELWLHCNRHAIRASVAMGVGAAIDFLAGEQVRAPRWIQSMRMEWLHRLATNPRRLIKRYALDAFFFPPICWKHWVGLTEADG